MGLIKPPVPARSVATTNAPNKPSNGLRKPADFSSLTGDVIPKGTNYFKPGSFGDFRDQPNHIPQHHEPKHVNGLDNDQDDALAMDELGRDPRDMSREIEKSAEDVRLEEELAARVSRVKLKRSHSNSSLTKSASPEKDEDTPAPPPTNPFLPASGFLSEPLAVPKEPETPAKKRKGSSDTVKSPVVPARGLFGSPPERGEGSGFGGMLGTAMDEEEEL